MAVASAASTSLSRAEVARSDGNQFIAATHSEVLLDEAAGQDLMIAFVGAPHRVGDWGAERVKSLREIGF